MFDPAEEKPIQLHDVPKISWLPKRPNLATIYRWATRGVRGVKLETLSIGSCKCTSEDALKRFFTRISDPTSSARPVAQRKTAIARANAALDHAGI